MAPLPWFKSNPTGTQCERQWFQPAKCQQGVSEMKFRDEYSEIYFALDRLVADSKNIFYVDPMKAFCQQSVCYSTTRDGTILYLDSSHLTAAGSTRVFQMILSPALSQIEAAE